MLTAQNTMSIIDIFVLGAGVYILYGYYLLMFKNEIRQGLLLPKDKNPAKCKDLEGFKKMVGLPMLLLGLLALAEGGYAIFQAYVRPVSMTLYWVLFGAFFAVLIWFTVMDRKAQKEFF